MRFGVGRQSERDEGKKKGGGGGKSGVGQMERMREMRGRAEV